MKHRGKKFFLLSALLLGGGISPAYALDFSFMGAVTLTNYNLTPSPISSSVGAGVGLGALAGFDLSPFLSLESGLLFLSHNFGSVGGSSTLAMSSNYVDIPLLMRISPISFISFEVGPYYGQATSVSPGPGRNDFGLLGGVGLRFPVLPTLKVRTEFLYQWGLANLDSNLNATQNSRNVLALVGVMFEVF